jgi:antitoxin VapB
MSLNIKNDEAERLARELASATGETVTRAITVAVRERLDRLEHRDQAAVTTRVGLLKRIAADAAPRWVEPQRSSQHGDLLYDESGIPR